MFNWGKREQRKDWEIEVDRILKEARSNSGLQRFMDKFSQEESSPPEEWQDIFNAFFEQLIGEAPALACCIFVFKAGQVWEKYKDELGG